MTEEQSPVHEEGEDDALAPPGPQMPLGIVIARITIVTIMSFAGAAAIFFLVGALWLYALASLGATALMVLLMFAIERAAEG